jgi:hypothetical protein
MATNREHSRSFAALRMTSRREEITVGGGDGSVMAGWEKWARRGKESGGSKRK